MGVWINLKEFKWFNKTSINYGSLATLVMVILVTLFSFVIFVIINIVVTLIIFRISVEKIWKIAKKFTLESFWKSALKFLEICEEYFQEVIIAIKKLYWKF
jgi:hypothetical protein